MAECSIVKGSYKIARIAGIDLRVHITFFLLLAWLGYRDYSSGGWGAMMSGMALIFLLFTCVVLHEFGHALAARMFGIRTPDITLLPIGGLARLERMPEKPSQEFVVAIAGPLVNVVIALGLLMVLHQVPALKNPTMLGEGQMALLESLFFINVILVLFNLLPAFPMDGGRILRALLAMFLKHARATRIASVVGRVAAVLMAVVGFILGDVFLILIAAFVFFGAQQEGTYAQAKEKAEETPLTQVMLPAPPFLYPSMTVAEAMQMAGQQEWPLFALVDGDLRFLGMVLKESLDNAFQRDASIQVATLAEPKEECLPANISMAQAWKIMGDTPQVIFPVVNASGQIVGMIAR